MNLGHLDQITAPEPNYRLKQIKQAVFKDFIENWDDATNLPLPLRQKLNQACPLAINSRLFVSRDRRTVKALISLDDSSQAETVLMKHGNHRRTACVSSQIGCPLGCTFCATGQMGFRRDLTASEIIVQVVLWNRHLHQTGDSSTISNIVFMGMGEPFLNYPEVMAAIRTLHDPDGFNIGSRKFSISTVGIVPGIMKLAKEKMQINLAISLHAPVDGLRSRLMPVNIQYPIKKILTAVDSCITDTNRKVMFEYLMIRGVNDSLAHAKELAAIMNRPLYLVNLITYNPTGIFEPSLPAQIARFKQVLEQAGINVSQRYRFGSDIQAACGQLAGREPGRQHH